MALAEGIANRVAEPAGMPLMAFTSGTYMYPLRGIWYFVRNPVLWGNLVGMALPQLILSSVVFTLCYVFLYPPQAAIGLFFNGPTGIVTAWIAMVQQAMAFTMALSEILLMPTPLRLLYDAVLTKEGHDKLVLAGKLRQEAEESPHQEIMTFVKKLPGRILLPIWAGKLAVRVGLTFVPVLGPVIMILISAVSVGTRCQSRYLELKGYAPAEVRNYVNTRRGQLFAFGIVASALESLPFIGIAFVFTNTTGGALWAVETESALSPSKRRQRPSRLRSLFL